MQPLGALSDQLTKLQLQQNSSLYQNLLSNTCSAWSLSNSVSSDNTAVAAVVFFRNGRRSRQYPHVALLLILALSFLHRTSAWHLAGVGDKQQKVRRPMTDAGGGFADASGRHGADDSTQRRPNHRSPPRGLPLPRMRCRSRREPQGAERALCRR